MQIWKGTAERREEMLLESRNNYSDLEREHKKLRSSKEKEIETLQNKWETSQETTAAVTREYVHALYVRMYTTTMYTIQYLRIRASRDLTYKLGGWN
jgi:hypothetical protein